MTENRTLKVKTHEFIAAVPRLLGYVPVAKVVVALVARDTGRVQVVAACEARSDGEVYEFATALQRAACDTPVAALVIGWRGSAPIRSATTRVADILVLTGLEVRCQVTTDGTRYADLTRRHPSQVVAAQVGPVAQVGTAPHASRADAVAAWTPAGSVTPVEDHRAMRLWADLLDGDTSADTVARAAYALDVIAARDRVFAALTGLDIGVEFGGAEHLTAYQRRPQVLDTLRAAVVQMQYGPVALPMLTLATGVAYSHGSAAASLLTDVIEQIDTVGEYRLADLLTTAIRAGVSPVPLFRR